MNQSESRVPICASNTGATHVHQGRDDPMAVWLLPVVKLFDPFEGDIISRLSVKSFQRFDSVHKPFFVLLSEIL